MKICFMGTPTFATKALNNLIKNGYPVSCIYTKAPKKRGRGLQVSLSDVHQFSALHNIPCRTPKSLKKSIEEQDYIIEQKFDLIIVASYGLILPESILNAPKYGAINIHASLLPKWRGASPIQMAIASGDSQTGITIMQMDKGLDTGDILLKEALDITENTTFNSLYEQLGDLGASMVIKVVQSLENNAINKIKQDDSNATHANLLTKEDGYLNFNETANAIDCKVRGFNPFPSTYMFYKENIKILDTTPLNTQHSEAIGTILSLKPLQVACSNSILQINSLQRKGKKALSSAEFIRGFQFTVGSLVKTPKHNN